MNIEKLSKSLDQDLRLEVSADEYIDAIDTLFQGNHSNNRNNNVDVEQILTRAFQDHSISRDHLKSVVQSNVSGALEIFGGLSIKTLAVLVGCFDTTQETLPLLQEIKSKLAENKTKDNKFLLTLVIQILSKFSYKFEDVDFLVKELTSKVTAPDVKSLTLLIFAQLEKTFKHQFEDKFISFTESLIIESEAGIKLNGEDPLIVVVDILTELYPALTTLCSRVFLGEELQKLLKFKSMPSNPLLVSNGLKLLSAGCVDENTRSYIAENYMEILEKSLKLEEFKLQSALVLVKTWSFTKLKDIAVNQLSELFIKEIQNSANDDNEDLAIEGLAYLSLKVSVKNRIRSNGDICLRLVDAAKSSTKNTSIKFGTLVILANLSTSPNDVSQEQTSMHNLKMYAEMKNPGDEKEQEKEDESDVVAFNRDYILDLEIISSLKVQFKNLSQGNRSQIIRIIYNLTKEVDCISGCIKQGGTAILVEFLVNSLSTDPFKLLASRSLAKILVNTDPKLIFNKFSHLNAISFLFDLIPSSDGSDLDAPITTRDTYEALLALTNLATIDDSDDLCKIIAQTPRYWDRLENLMLDETVQIQRSALELLCNLMVYPLPIAVKFFNFDNPKSVRNFNLLTKLLKLEDIQSQRAVVGIFANIAGTVPFIAQDLLHKNDLIDALIDLLATQTTDRDLRQRLLFFFNALISVASPNEKTELLNKKELEEALKIASKWELKNGEGEYSEVIASLLK